MEGELFFNLLGEPKADARLERTLKNILLPASGQYHTSLTRSQDCHTLTGTADAMWHSSTLVFWPSVFTGSGSRTKWQAWVLVRVKCVAFPGSGAAVILWYLTQASSYLVFCFEVIKTLRVSSWVPTFTTSSALLSSKITDCLPSVACSAHLPL